MTEDGQDTLQAALEAVLPHVKQIPNLAVVLGSGLGGFAEALQVQVAIPYASIPGIPVSTAIGHKGQLLFGTIDGEPLAVLQGRSHFYEGAAREQVSCAVRVLHALGIQTLLLTCAAGGLNARFRAGDLMLICDTIDLLHRRNRSALNFLRPKFRPETSLEVNQQLAQCALENALPLVSGTYVAVTGPNYETRAEQRFLRMFADAVGMSTVPEIEAAAALGMQVAALAMITNVCTPDAPQETTGDGVLQVAVGFLPAFRKLVVSLARTLGK